jgi:hypothetical protein
MKEYLLCDKIRFIIRADIYGILRTALCNGFRIYDLNKYYLFKDLGAVNDNKMRNLYLTLILDFIC